MQRRLDALLTPRCHQPVRPARATRARGVAGRCVPAARRRGSARRGGRDGRGRAAAGAGSRQRRVALGGRRRPRVPAARRARRALLVPRLDRRPSSRSRCPRTRSLPSSPSATSPPPSRCARTGGSPPPTRSSRSCSRATPAWQRGRLIPDALIVGGLGDPAALPAVAEGRATPQDQGSQAVVALLDPQPGDRVLDVAAAPGGKATAVAERVGRAASSWRPTSTRASRSGDPGGRRASHLPEVVGVVADGRRLPVRDGSFDRVLVDAPCSGLGVLRRRPEARWRIRPEAVDQLVALQRSLLSAAARAVAPGGRLLYSVCTLTRAETSGIGGWAIAAPRRVHRRAAPGRPVATARSGRGAVAPHCRHRRHVRARRLRRTGRRVAFGPVKIAPSILSADFSRLGADIARVSRRGRPPPRRRDGRPLRAQPHDRPAGGGVAAAADRPVPRLSPDGRQPRRAARRLRARPAPTGASCTSSSVTPARSSTACARTAWVSASC